MRSYNSTAILEELQADVRHLILATTYLQKEDPELLAMVPAPGRWSAIQVLEHLNSYGRYYLPAIKRSMRVNKAPKEKFTPGWFGNYFTRIMKPGPGGTVRNKMRAPKAHRPPAVLDIKPVMDDFMDQQQQLLNLLEQAKQKNIGAIRTPISISRFIKLKLGDTFRFLIAHEQRHFLQITNTIREIQLSRGKFQSAPLAT